MVAIPYTIQDVSEEGASIWTANNDVLPGHVDICYSRDGGVRRACDVIWRRGNLMGVRFRDRADAQHARFTRALTAF